MSADDIKNALRLASEQPAVTLTHEQADFVRGMLIIGLSSYGQVERITDRFHLLTKISDRPDDGLLPLHPTGLSTTTSDFASALSYLQPTYDESDTAGRA